MPFLDWVNKAQARDATGQVPIHLLKQESVHGDAGERAPENLLIQGDNLLALKALLPVYAGRVKCIFIDPPYNTQSAFEHYDDKLEHSQWLSMMYPRLVLLRDLLAEDGSIWVTIDDNEAHYLKVLMDEVFGRKNFVSNVVWQKTLTRRNDARAMSTAHDHVLTYARSFERFLVNKLQPSNKQRDTYQNRDNDSRGDWLPVPFHAPGIRPNLTYEIVTPSGRSLWPPEGRCWSTTKEKFAELVSDGRIYFGRDGNGMAQRKKFWNESENKIVPWTWWGYEDAGDNREANREAKLLADASVTGARFETPKPEKLIALVLEIATNQGDVVLDSFLGSGTTAAVAHKMNRCWIGIEMGEHARTHCIPRLEKVVAGEQGGISESVGWKGGGAFRFCKLGEAAFDADGRINPKVRFGTLATFIWHCETDTPAAKTFRHPLLGRHNGTAYYLLYNGILGDRRPDSGNVLTHAVLRHLLAQYPHDGPKVIYGETTGIGAARLATDAVTFKQIPYDVKIR